MILAHRAGIPIFATGGIGGVHRGHPFDVSADLAELGADACCCCEQWRKVNIGSTSNARSFRNQRRASDWVWH